MGLDQTVRDISEEISSRISAAAMGRGEWSDVCAGFTRAFPGSFAALLNQNFVRPEVSFAKVDGLEDQYLQSFVTHYSYVNPWRRFWEFASNGAICVSERDDPATKYKKSAFYNEWMRSIGDYDASIGLRLQVNDDYIIYLPVHFSVSLSEVYESRLEAVIANTRRSLTNAIQIASYLRDTSDYAAARSALVGRSNAIAFVVDRAGRLKDANHRAIDAFARARPVLNRQGSVRFVQPEITTWLGKLLHESPPDLTRKRVMNISEERWLISVNQLPVTMFSQLIRGQDQFLVQLTDLGSNRSCYDGDLLAEAYRITPAEIRLCRALSAGLLLNEAASCSGISYENARQKLKSIFRKTGVSNQSDLKLLLNSLA